MSADVSPIALLLSTAWYTTISLFGLRTLLIMGFVGACRKGIFSCSYATHVCPLYNIYFTGEGRSIHFNCNKNAMFSRYFQSWMLGHVGAWARRCTTTSTAFSASAASAIMLPEVFLSRSFLPSSHHHVGHLVILPFYYPRCFVEFCLLFLRKTLQTLTN